MLKIVDGIPFLGERSERFRVRAHDLGNGHLEVTASRCITWREMVDTDEYPTRVADTLAAVERAREEPRTEEDEERDRQRAARRAKTRIRRLCKAMGADTLLTLTYRANQTDLDLAKRQTKEFVRRLSRYFPREELCGPLLLGQARPVFKHGFRAVVGFEQQQRGAWHMHFATSGIPSWFEVRGLWVRSFDLLRSVWRSVAGELGGNVDVQRRRRHAKKTPAQIAAYLSKYVTKAFTEGEKWSNRWTKYGDVDTPVPVDLGEVGSLHVALADAFALVDAAAVVVTSRLDRWKEWYFLAVEKPAKLRRRGAE